MARRGWANLSDNYRRRLERAGVTQASYEAGNPLAKARGHRSTAHEQVQSRSYREINTWVRQYAATYGRDEDDVREALMEHGRAEAERAIRLQRDLEHMYDRGQHERATQRWTMPRQKPFPDWIFYYHGTFS